MNQQMSKLKDRSNYRQVNGQVKLCSFVPERCKSSTGIKSVPNTSECPTKSVQILNRNNSGTI